MKISAKEKLFAAAAVAVLAIVLLIRMNSLYGGENVDLDGTVSVVTSKAAVSVIEGKIKVKEAVETVVSETEQVEIKSENLQAADLKDDNVQNKDTQGFIEKEIQTTASGIVVPAKSVIYRDGRLVVVTLDKNNHPQYIDVEVGLKNNKSVQIVKGLEEGQIYLIEGQQYVEEGREVKILYNMEKTKK